MTNLTTERPPKPHARRVRLMTSANKLERDKTLFAVYSFDDVAHAPCGLYDNKHDADNAARVLRRKRIDCSVRPMTREQYNATNGWLRERAGNLREACRNVTLNRADRPRMKA